MMVMIQSVLAVIDDQNCYDGLMMFDDGFDAGDEGPDVEQVPLHLGSVSQHMRPELFAQFVQRIRCLGLRWFA